MAPRRPPTSSSPTASTEPVRSPHGGEVTFADLGVPAELCTVLSKSGITLPFPIQTATLPDSLAGRDVLGRGRTGSGKTLAFALPMLTRLAADRRDRGSGRPRALILAPTRELVSQIDEAIRPLARPLGLRTLTVFGGVGQGPQVNSLRSGVDIVVACPGRLEDLIGQGHAKLDRIEITVLDEADHMADLGFLPVVRRIMDRTPQAGQRMLFSATLDNGIDVIVKRYLTDPVTHSVDSAESPVATMTHHVLHVSTSDRLPVLVDLTSAPGRTMVFTRTKHRAKQLTKQLNAHGVPAVEMHGNLAQNARTRNLAAFSDGRATALVATDIAAARHPRRRRHPRDPRRPARRAQGVPAPFRSHRPGRGRRHRRHPGHREPARRRAPAGSQGRHQPDHHVGASRPSAARRAGPGAAFAALRGGDRRSPRSWNRRERRRPWWSAQLPASHQGHRHGRGRRRSFVASWPLRWQQWIGPAVPRDRPEVAAAVPAGRSSSSRRGGRPQSSSGGSRRG